MKNIPTPSDVFIFISSTCTWPLYLADLLSLRLDGAGGANTDTVSLP